MKKKMSKKTGELPVTAVSYNGPVLTKADANAVDVKTMVLLNDSAFTANSGGSIQTIFNFENPSTTVDWSNATGLYDEFRVLALEVEFVPNCEDCLDTAGLALAHFPIYSVIDHDTNSVLTTYGNASQYVSMKSHSLTKRWKVIMRMAGPNVGNGATGSLTSTYSESSFMNCANPPTVCGSIKLFSQGLTGSATYGRIISRWRVQFRGRGL